MNEIQFYTDEHIAGSVVAGLRRRNINVLTTHEANMRGATDSEQLAFATGQQRAIITKDDDFLRLHAQRTSHRGIVFVDSQASVGEMVRGLLLIYQVMDAEELYDHVEFL